MKGFFFTLLLICAHSFISYAAFAVKLTNEEVKEISSQGFSTNTKKIADHSWPQVIIKAKIKTNPLSSVAIFAAYEHQKNYIPNLIKSKIHKVVAPNQIQVSYELDMPWPIPNSKYINDHTLESSHKNHYKVSWISLKNNSAKSVQGSALFLPYPGESGHTLMIYENHVVPNSIFASLLQGPMISDTESSIRAIIKEAETLSVQKSTRLLTFESKILDALSHN